mmetsp:Transcript_70720/g.202627  ORF Transcript_70720/g.202627 Transcript_70720/m.202627 type:complete len:260 (+) Transcript_70720:683-1462(+)
MAFLGGPVQGREAAFVHGGQVAGVGDQVLQAVRVPELRAQMQGCDAINIRLVQRRSALQQALLNLAEVTRLGRILQGLVEAAASGQGVPIGDGVGVDPRIGLLGDVGVEELVGAFVRRRRRILCAVACCGVGGALGLLRDEHLVQVLLPDVLVHEFRPAEQLAANHAPELRFSDRLRLALTELLDLLLECLLAARGAAAEGRAAAPPARDRGLQEAHAGLLVLEDLAQARHLQLGAPFLGLGPAKLLRIRGAAAHPPEV